MDHPWGKDRRLFHGGEYPYETSVTVYLPEGVSPTNVDGAALESRGMVLLGQLEVYRRRVGLPSLATHYTDRDGAYYEYGFIMGRPFVRVWPTGGTNTPISGLSGIVFYNEAIRSAHLYKQGVVARDSGSKPSKYVVVDAPWSGYASKNKRLLLGGAATAIDERLMFKPHAVAWSRAYTVHVVVQRQINADDALSRIFIGGFSVLASGEVDFVGAQLYSDALVFAYIDPDQNLVFASIPSTSITYAASFTYDPGNTSPKTPVPDLVGSEETICNFHPLAKRASFLSALQTQSGATYTIDYTLGTYSDGTIDVEETVTGLVLRDTISVSTSPHITSVVRTAVYYVDADESYQGLTAYPPHRVTDDFEFSCIVPETEFRVDLSLLPIWTGYNEAGTRVNWRLSGFSSSIISGTIARARHYDTDETDDETYSASVPTTVHTTEIDLTIYHFVDGVETAAATYPVERTNWTTGQDPSDNTISDNFVTAHAAIVGDKFVVVRLSGTEEISAPISVPMSSAATTNDLGGIGTFNPNTNSSTSGTMRVPLISATSSNGYPAVDYSFRKYNAYQDIRVEDQLSVEFEGSTTLDVRPIGDNALYDYAGPELGGMRDGLGPDPYTGGEAFGPITVTRTVTYTVESNPNISANASNNVFISNYMGRGCLYDYRLKKHIISPWGVYSSDVIHAYGGETKKVYCANAVSSLDITADFLTADADEDSSAQMPVAQTGDIFTDDFYDPRGLI